MNQPGDGANFEHPEPKSPAINDIPDDAGHSASLSDSSAPLWGSFGQDGGLIIEAACSGRSSSNDQSNS